MNSSVTGSLEDLKQLCTGPWPGQQGAQAGCLGCSGRDRPPLGGGCQLGVHKPGPCHLAQVEDIELPHGPVIIACQVCPLTPGIFQSEEQSTGQGWAQRLCPQAPGGGGRIGLSRVVPCVSRASFSIKMRHVERQACPQSHQDRE